MYTFPIKSPRWIWIALLICLFVVRQYAFPLTDIKCAAGQWKIFNTIHKNYTCRSCPTCPSEHGLSVKCDTVVTQQANLECEKCVSGVNHSSDTNKEQCQPCKSTTCLENEIVNGSCSPEKDTTSCSGICEKGSMNSDKTRCVHLSIVEAGDNITLNDVRPVHTTPSTKTHKLSGLLIALIVFGCLIITLGVAYCFYRQSHSRKQASENVELRDTDSGARTPSTGNNKQEETEALISDEDNGQLIRASPNLGEALSSLSSTPQETASTDPERLVTTTAEIETETSEAVPINNNTCDCETPCLHVEPKTTATDENRKFSAASPPSLSTPSHTPPPCTRLPRRPTKIGDLNENYYAKVCESLNLHRPGKDWRTMAGEMDYTNNKVRCFEQFNKDNPTDAVLRDWSTTDGNDVYKLISICKDIGRDDVVTILEVALGIRRQSGVEEVGN